MSDANRYTTSRPVRVLAVLAMSAVLASCSITQTAAFKQKPEAQVTSADRVEAWNAWSAWVDAQHVATENDPILVCIRGHESANLPNPWAAYNPDGPYFGAYQWLQGSWNSAAGATGRPDLIGLTPSEPSVSRWDQDSVTLAYHHMVGDGPWGNRCG